MSVKIAAQFKKDTRPLNGLEAIAEELVEEPHKRWFIIAEVENRRTSIDHSDGDTQSPTVNLLHIEPMLSDKDEKTVREMLKAAYKARTGNNTVEPAPTLFDGAKGSEGEDQADGEGPTSERKPDEWIDPAAK